MSAGYASRLKEYPNKGICGLPEQKDTRRSYQLKMQQLFQLIQQSSYIVILTGAGISTAAGIQDFRGPRGIWTLEQQKELSKRGSSKKRRRNESGNSVSTTRELQTEEIAKEAKNEMNFTAAMPTLTHNIITSLVARDIVKFVITQNVDGLHRRSGLLRAKHSVLHGCAFTEKCEICCTEFFRDTDVGGMSFQKTGRECDLCNGDLRDTLLDWDDPLPEDDLERSEYHCKNADLVLCLGTSLRIQPANQLPLKAKRFVIVNLQQTPMDEQAALIVRERVDIVMEDIEKWLSEADLRANTAIDRKQTTPQIERVWKMDPADISK
jgi:NAD+-dependent protein deacetylase sirtuin 6